jgi:hypothetical protein
MGTLLGRRRAGELEGQELSAPGRVMLLSGTVHGRS